MGVVHLVKEQQLMTKVCRMISSGSKMKARMDGKEKKEINFATTTTDEAASSC